MGNITSYNVPKVSVIIPAYNFAKYLSEAIDSVLAQGFYSFEIIVVDDGSTDNTREIVSKYISEYPDKIKYLFQENSGPGAAKNTGIKESRGAYITFLDADDCFLPGSLSKRALFLDKVNEISAVFSDYIVEHSNEQIERKPRLKEERFLDFFKESISHVDKSEVVLNNKFFYKYLDFSPIPICSGNLMIRRTILKDTGLFRTDIFPAEDTEFGLRIIIKHKLGFINEPLFIYKRYRSFITKENEKYYLDCITFYEDLMRSLQDKGVRKTIKKRLGLLYSSLGYYYRTKHEYKKVFFPSLKSIFFNPVRINPYKNILHLFIPHSLKKMLSRKEEITADDGM